MVVNENVKSGWRFSVNPYGYPSWVKLEQAYARMLGRIARITVIKPVKPLLIPVISGFS